MRIFDTVECIGSEMPPNLNTFELHLQFQDPDKGHQLAVVGAQFLLQVLQSFSKKGSKMEMQAFFMWILVELKEFEGLQHNKTSYYK